MREIIDVHEVFAGYFAGVEALAYAVSKTLAEGSICLDIKSFIQSVETNDESWQQNPFKEEAKPVDKMIAEGLFVTHFEKELKPFVIQNGKVYLHRYFTYETQIIEHIQRLGKNFHIITGGPGTGKTYGVASKLVELFKGNSELKVTMAAPTGKAAARMEESIRKFTGDPDNILTTEIKEKLNALKAKTIHRLLGYIHNSVFFRHNENKPLPYDVVIIDEASMIDGAMMAKLLSAINAETTFYLIGDKDQLASVEAGSVFGDICRAKDSRLLKDKVEVMVENFRAEGKHIITFSKKLIEGETAFILNYENNKEVFIDIRVDGKRSDDLFKKEVFLYKEYIEESDIKTALQKLNRVRVLCVTREHDHSVAEANAQIEKLLKKEINDSEKFNPKAGFYHNQPIIITKNDDNLKLANGDVGLIRRDETGELKAYFEHQEKPYPAGYLNNYETVFAMTIHKSQGSEFDHVVVMLPQKQARKLLTRELLYTAVTRAKKRVLVQSTKESLEHCLNNGVSRASGLTERVQDAK
jgi:exodeoxyribonuclease V alpha subunit